MNFRNQCARTGLAIFYSLVVISSVFSQTQTPITPVQELARKIAEAKTEAERDSLLAANKELQNVDLRKALLSEGSRLRVEGSYDRSTALDEYIQKFAARIGDQLGVAGAINSIGVDYQEQGQYKTAIEYFNKSLELKISLKDYLGAAYSINNIGLGYSYMGDYSRAQEYLLKALKIFEDLNRKDLMPNPLNNLGIVQRRLGNYAQAQEYYEQSLKLYEEAKNKFGISLALSNLAVLKTNTGDFPAALELNQRGLALREEIGNKGGISISLNNIGNIYLEQNQLPDALDAYQKELKLAEETKTQDSQATALTSIAEVNLKLQHPAEALKYSKLSRNIAQAISSEELLWNDFKIEGMAYRQLHQNEDARKSFDSAIKIIESRRSNLSSGGTTQNYFSNKMVPYHEIIKLLINQSDVLTALDYAEHAKARTLVDILSAEPVSISSSMSDEEKKRESEINARIALLNRQILLERARQPQPDAARLKELEENLDKARIDYEEFRVALYNAHPSLQTNRGESQIITPAEIAGDLLRENGKILLEYVVTNDATYLFTITKSKNVNAKSPVEIKVHKIEIPQADLAKQTENFRQKIATRDEYELPSRALYDLLIAPAEKELKGKNKIVIVPDASLWNLPFQTLLNAQKHFLLEYYSLSYAPSLTALREMQKVSRAHAEKSGGEKSLLAFGNPTFEAAGEISRTNPAILRSIENSLSPLPDAEKEVLSLRDLYGANRSEIYVEKDAREDRAKTEASRFKVIQFATHSVFNDTNPLYSYLLMSPNPETGDDGLLEARELINLNLSADLVVLSACETARGRVNAGEGLTGMTWALFVAGVPSTVASQWKVPSVATSEIMLDFHRNLLNKIRNFDKAAALRQAELGFLRRSNFKHPFYWAGFVLIGKD